MARIPWDDACIFDPSLEVLRREWPHPPAFVETLAGGLTNRCWKIIDVRGQALIWRPVTNLTRDLAISRLQEFQVLSAIENATPYLGPKALAHYPEGLLVEWVEGVDVAALSDKDCVRLLAEIHRQDICSAAIAPFNFTARMDHYWLTLQNYSIDLTEFEVYYRQLRMMPNIPAVGLSLCHFDLGSHNVIRSKQGLKIIDWEYASLADPRFDIAMTISMEELEIPSIVAQYCQLTNQHQVDDWITGVRAWTPRVYILSALWYLIGYHHGGREEYLRSARNMLAEIHLST